MHEMIKKKLYEICDECKADKTLTKKKLHAMKSIYPVYTANIGIPFEYADFYNNDEPAIIAVNDGAAGRCYIVEDDKYVIGKHASGFKIKSQYKDCLDLTFLKLSLEPIFINKNKAQGLGNLPKVDMLETEINIPILENGEFDINRQKEIAQNYINIEREKELLKIQRNKIENFVLEKIEGYNLKAVPLFELFRPRQGNAIYTKKNIHNKGWVGKIPVISSNTDNNGILDYIDEKYVNDKDYITTPCLTWSVDGYAGKLFARNMEKNSIGFVANNHCGILYPLVDTAELYFPYLIYTLQPEFFKRTKNSCNKKLGNNQMVDIMVDIPVDSEGKFDLRAQIEIAKKYETIDRLKGEIIKKINELIDMNINIM